MRLNKYLSDAGVCSRREADRLTEAGEITVNGKRAETGMQVESGDVVVVKGKTVVPEEKKVYLAFNKPRGIVCTAEKREKNNVIDYLSYPVRIYPVGRLDKDSEGLLLMTNDAFEKLLDDLFQTTAWDISSDISVLQTMLAQEGLTNQAGPSKQDIEPLHM